MSDQALAQAELVVRTIAQTAVDNEKYFCDLDAAADEDRNHSHQADRRYLRPDLGHRVPARRLVVGRQPGAERRGCRHGAPGVDRGDQAARWRGARRQDAARLPVPAVDELERAAKVARSSAEATNGMLAQHGRASYTGDRSRSSPDAVAVAVAVAVMFEAVLEAWEQAQVGSV